ncbi:hypothetical protein B0H10DRAFT_2095897, partial [Mycena sp. CBHHK59/15]
MDRVYRYPPPSAGGLRSPQMLATLLIAAQVEPRGTAGPTAAREIHQDQGRCSSRTFRPGSVSD